MGPFLLITLVWLSVTIYANEIVLAPEVMADIVRRTSGVEMSVVQLDQLRRRGRWAYPLLPALLAIRVGVVALTLQMVSMLMAHAVPYREAFRAGLWGFTAVAYGAFVRTLRLDLLPAGGLTRAELAVVPDSLAAILSRGGGELTVLSSALGVLSLHDAFWICLVAACLKARTDLGTWRALAVTVGAWCTTAAARVGTQVLMIGMLG